MLYTVTKLRQYLVRNVAWALGNKVDTDALGTDQLYHLFNFLIQCFWHIAEKKMSFVKEEHQLRLVRIAHLRKLLKKLR